MLVEIKEVSKRLGKFKLEQITMSLPKGYIMGLIGPNGAGKTSLLHLILGLYQPDEGQVLVDGKSYEDNEEVIHEMIGTVLQEELFENGLTLCQNAEMYGKYYRNYSSQVLEQYLKRFELDGMVKYKSLSKGQRLKFQFAFALAHDAKLLILDEPTGNFDPEFREEFFAVLKEFINDGERSVILSTHLTEDLDRIADYILYLEKGETLYCGDIETLHDRYRLVTGELYKIKLLRREDMIHLEEGTYGYRVLVRHRQRYIYDESLTVSVPTIEELMYFMTKRERTVGGRTKW